MNFCRKKCCRNYFDYFFTGLYLCLEMTGVNTQQNHFSD